MHYWQQMKMEIMQHAYCKLWRRLWFKIRGKKSLFFPQFLACLVFFFSFWMEKSNVSVIQQWFTILNNHRRISLFILLEANQGIRSRGSLSDRGDRMAQRFPTFEGEQRKHHCPRGPLCYQQHKDSHPRSPVIPTCISNDFQKKSKKESTVVLSFHWRQIEKAFSLKSVAWFTVFSPLSICALPFSLLLFPCLLFLWLTAGSLLLPFFDTIWSLKCSTVISIKGSMQPPLWNVFGAVWINVLRRRRWVPGNSSRQNCNPIPVLQSNHLQR